MALTPTVLITGGTTIDSTAFTSSASIAPAAGRLLTAFVGSHSSNGVAVPTMSGNGLTWETVGTASDANAFTQMTVFRAMGSPSSGIVSFNFGSVSAQQTFFYSIVEWYNASTSGTNGSGAIVQTSTGSNVSGAGSSVLTLTLATPFSASSNAAVVAWAARNSTAVSIDPAWVNLSSVSLTNTASMYSVSWFSGQDLSISSTQAGTNIVQSGVMLELAELDGGLGARLAAFRGARLLGLGAM